MTFSRALMLAASTLALGQLLMADQYNKKTKITFSGPVDIPGAVLPAGTYVFKLMDSQSNRNIVQVTNPRGNKVFATILAINDYRVNATSKTITFYKEQAPGTPPKVKSWFYPGDNYGARFVYPKAKAVEIAKVNKAPVPSLPAAAPAPEAKLPPAPAKVVAVTPKEEEVVYDVKIVEIQDAADTEGVNGEPVQEAPAEAPKLPKTSSPVHLAAGMGALLLGASALSRYAAKRLR
jgi:hypothetical protein